MGPVAWRVDLSLPLLPCGLAQAWLLANELSYAAIEDNVAELSAPRLHRSS